MPADTLEKAFNALDPQHPVKLEEVQNLFVERPNLDTRRMLAHLLTAQRPAKLLFIGHRGAGKSSELSFLASQIKGKAQPVWIPLYNIFQSAAVTHAEVILAINLRLIRLATDEKVVSAGLLPEAWNGFIKSRYLWLRQAVFGESSEADNIPLTEVTTKINLGAAEIEAKIGTSHPRAR